MKKLLPQLAVFIGLSSMGSAQTLEDFPCNVPYTPSAGFTINAPCVNVTTAGLTNIFGTGSCGSGVFAQPDGWGWFQGDGSTVTIDYNTTTGDPILSILTIVTTPCTFSAVTCADNNGTGGNESVTINTVAGTFYLIMIEEFFGGTTSGCLQLTSPVSGCTDPGSLNYNPLATVSDGSCTYPGPVYLQPTTGLLSSFSGACPVSTANGTYYDDGGAAANYVNGTNLIYRTFCPSTAGTCVNMNFTSFATENGIDYLTVSNGPAQNSPAIVQAPTTNAFGEITGTPALPFSFQSTNTSGCLTVRYSSDFSITDYGWSAVISNVACAEAQPAENSDCSAATAICSNTTFNDNSNGPGLDAGEGCDACLTGEVFSNWYTYTIQTGGTLGLSITPNAAADYDFTLYRGTCGGLVERCSFSDVVGNTGLGNGAVDTSEPVTGDSWVSTMNVVAGEVYFLLVNSWTAGGPGFNLNWTLTSGASLDCTVLPIELSIFEAEYSPEARGTDIYWKTETEKDNDYFIVEKSRDGTNFEKLFRVEGAGNSSDPIDYFAFDPNVEPGYTYYRLKQVDINGDFEYSEVISIHALSDDLDKMTLTPNPASSTTEVFFNNYKQESATLSIMNAQGIVVMQEEIACAKGGNTVTLDLKDYRGGIYFVSIITDNKTYTGKLVKN
ncbi:MAG: T9SS type A sorting domain-containing protein [Crocinitomicaceae bacterium]|nr:T9SS type A sorting domain-containing protein [Crocinitomicaceae bacterium]